MTEFRIVCAAPHEVDDPTYTHDDEMGEELSPLVHVAGSTARDSHHKCYRSLSLGALGLVLVVAACVSYGAQPDAPNTAHAATVVHANDVVQFSKASDSIEGKGNNKGQGVESKGVKGKAGKAKGQGEDEGQAAESGKVGQGDLAVMHVRVPPTMHLVHRDFSKDCGPPLFQCISKQVGPTPSLQRGSALIKVSGSAVNHDDPSEGSWYRQYYQNVTLGLDASGLVVAVGEGCARLKVGDHVWSTFPMLTSAFYGSGGLAEYATVVCAYSGIAPSSIDLALAGTLPTDALTSLGALQAAGAPWTPEKVVTVLIVAGTGGTGYSAVQLAKHLGATTVVTAAGHEDGVRFVKSLGADVAVDYHTKSVFDAIPDGTVDVVFDNHGVNKDLALKKLKPGGIFIGIVNTISTRTQANGIRQMFYYVWSDDQLPTLADKLDLLANVIDAGKFQVFVDETYELDDIKDAYTRLFQGNLQARISIVPTKSDRATSKKS